jgi:hypothetical protein
MFTHHAAVLLAPASSVVILPHSGAITEEASWICYDITVYVSKIFQQSATSPRKTTTQELKQHLLLPLYWSSEYFSHNWQTHSGAPLSPYIPHNREFTVLTRKDIHGMPNLQQIKYSDTQGNASYLNVCLSPLHIQRNTQFRFLCGAVDLNTKPRKTLTVGNLKSWFSTWDHRNWTLNEGKL